MGIATTPTTQIQHARGAATTTAAVLQQQGGGVRPRWAASEGGFDGVEGPDGAAAEGAGRGSEAARAQLVGALKAQRVLAGRHMHLQAPVHADGAPVAILPLLQRLLLALPRTGCA